jgi:DNA-binding MarR family transcriptional regulator
MASGLGERIKQHKFRSVGHEALLNLLVASEHIHQKMEVICAEFGITPSQFNVLRILRGGYPEGYPRCDIADRMVIRAPDVTRLVDRLEAQGLAERIKSEGDRRLSLTRITKEGLDLVGQMDEPVSRLHDDIEQRVGRKDCRILIRLCEAVYNG